jgi:hypothetical protein
MTAIYLLPISKNWQNIGSGVGKMNSIIRIESGMNGMQRKSYGGSRRTGMTQF